MLEIMTGALGRWKSVEAKKRLRIVNFSLATVELTYFVPFITKGRNENTRSLIITPIIPEQKLKHLTFENNLTVE